MSKFTGKYLPFLVVFLVALTLDGARAQIEPSTVSPTGLPRQDTSEANCASADSSDCKKGNSFNSLRQLRATGRIVLYIEQLESDLSPLPDIPLEDGFESPVIYPSDMNVVPQQLNKTTLLSGLTDWSVAFSQFALGTAAIDVLNEEPSPVGVHAC